MTLIRLYLQKELCPNEAHCYPLDSFTFSGGEDHIKIPDLLDYSLDVQIVARVNSSSDLMKVILAKDALDRMGFKNVSLFLPYIPYARQDRVMSFGEPLSIKVFADHINLCGFSKITVLDPHSDVAHALINRVEVESLPIFIVNAFFDIIRRFDAKTENIRIVSPDAGAEKKVYKIGQALNHPHEIIQCSKHRDPLTREITQTRVHGDVQGMTCIIIDDICDGGRTFSALAAKLKSLGAEKVFLIVTHGIFSHGESQLTDLDHIYSTNSWRQYQSDLITFYSFTDQTVITY